MSLHHRVARLERLYPRPPEPSPWVPLLPFATDAELHRLRDLGAAQARRALTPAERAEVLTLRERLEVRHAQP
jgi:hypothetical protein